MISAPSSDDFESFHELIGMDKPDVEAVTSMVKQFRSWIMYGHITTLTAYSSNGNSVWETGDHILEINDSNTVFLIREALSNPRLKEIGIDTSAPLD